MGEGVLAASGGDEGTEEGGVGGVGVGSGVVPNSGNILDSMGSITTGRRLWAGLAGCGCIDSASSCSLSSKPNVTSTCVLELEPTMTTGGVSTLGDVGGSEAALLSGTPICFDNPKK